MNLKTKLCRDRKKNLIINSKSNGLRSRVQYNFRMVNFNVYILHSISRKTRSVTFNYDWIVVSNADFPFLNKTITKTISNVFSYFHGDDWKREEFSNRQQFIFVNSVAPTLSHWPPSFTDTLNTRFVRSLPQPMNLNAILHWKSHPHKYFSTQLNLFSVI